MPTRRILLVLVVALLIAVPPLLARGEEPRPPVQDPQVAMKALRAAIARGKKLWSPSWGEGTKTCAECHQPGPNRMHGGRIRRYPAYDFGMGKVVTLNQKLAQMLTEQSKGKALPLGHADLTALEAYLKTLR